MRAGSVAGRVSTLAVAVGVGIAAATGVAAADTEGPDDTGTTAASSPADTTSTGADTGQTQEKADTKAAAEAEDGKAEEDAAAAAKEAEKAEKKAAKAAAEEAEAAQAEEAEQDEQDEQAEQAEQAEQTEAEQTEAEQPEQTRVATTEVAAPEPSVVETAAETPQTPAGPAVETPAETVAQTSEKAPEVVETPTTEPTATAAARESANTPKVQTSEPVVEKTTETVALKTVETVEPAPEVVAVAAEADVPVESVTSVTLVQEPAKSKPSLGTALDAVRVGVQKLLTGVAALFGLTQNSTQSTGLAALVALLGWGTRRELTETSVASPEVTTFEVMSLAAVASSPTTMVGWLTGSKSINNTMARFGIYGTDLGIMWDNGVTGDNPNTSIVEQRQILIAFGDTFTNAAMTTGWRNNVLLRSADTVLSDGIYVADGIVDRPGIPDGAYSGAPMSLTVAKYAREIIGKYPYTKNTQVTIIPTGAIAVAGAGVNGAARQYVSFMSVKKWGAAGSWTTNYSAIAYSDDNGQNWTVVPQSSVRAAAYGSSTVSFKSGNQNFQMVSFVRPPAGSADAAAGYIYATGTPSGRSGTVYLSRVKEASILDVSKYEYWDGKKWVANKPSAATPILPKTTTKFLFFSSTKNTTAGELSVQYNSYLKKYVMLYTDGSNNVVMRTADSMNGTWSSGTTLVTSSQYPGLYAPMIHPWSGTSQLTKTDGSVEDPQYLYWNMSLWGDYNVALMKTDLSQLGLVSV